MTTSSDPKYLATVCYIPAATAYYCPDCRVVTNVDHCPACASGNVHPIQKWLDGAPGGVGRVSALEAENIRLREAVRVAEQFAATVHIEKDDEFLPMSNIRVQVIRQTRMARR